MILYDYLDCAGVACVDDARRVSDGDAPRGEPAAGADKGNMLGVEVQHFAGDFSRDYADRPCRDVVRGVACGAEVEARVTGSAVVA